MPEKKTLQQREHELLSLIVTRAGREELEALARRYEASGGKARPAHKSLITYIIVHERALGLIEGGPAAPPPSAPASPPARADGEPVTAPTSPSGARRRRDGA
jgi:hypothetical protein